MKAFKVTSIILLISALFFQVMGQQEPGLGGKLRQRFIQIKLNEIGRDLNLTPDRMTELRPIYRNYEMEKNRSRLGLARSLMRVDPDSLSDAEAERLVKTQLENAKRLIEVREKYYDEFRKVLTPREIIKLYQCENDIQRRIAQEFKRRNQRFLNNK